MKVERMARSDTGQVSGLQDQVSREFNRRRLIELDRGEPILVAEAPSGYGKTVFVRSWLQQAPAGVRRVWVSLDDSARDPTVFLERLSVALIGPSRHKREAVLDDEADRAERFALIADELGDVQRPVWLVFDDAHCLAGSASRQYLKRLLLGSGSHFRIFLAMQPVSLDVSLGELTSQGRVCWINAGALALTREEVEACARLRGYVPEPRQLNWLLRATQGWPALVQLALAAPPDGGPFVPGNIASLGPVREYIYERFLTRLEPVEQDLVWMLACIGNAPLGLLRALSASRTDPDTCLPRLFSLGIAQQHEVLEEPSIRLHPLVGEAVLRVLAKDRAKGKSALLLTAARWYWRHEMGAAAVRLLLEADTEHLPLARDWLLELASALIFKQGQHQTLLDLVELWERVTAGSDSRLDRMAAWALIFQRRFEAAQERLRRALADPADREAVDEEQLQQAVIAALRDDYDSAGNLALAYLERHRNECSFYSSTALTVHAFRLKCDGDIAAARAALRDAHVGFNQAQSGFGTAWVFVVGAVASIRIGRHRDALAEVERGLERCGDSSGLGGQRAMLRGVEAFVRYERNELASVRNILGEALLLLPDQSVVDTMVLGFTAAARLRAATGDFGAALDILSEGERYGLQREFPRLSLSLAAERALLLLRSGATSQARQIAESAGLVPNGATEGGLHWDRAGRLYARLALLDGDAERARKLLAAPLARARAGGQHYKLCELLILAALTEDIRDEEGKAFELVREALELASTESYIRLVLDEGPELHRLIRRWLKANNGNVRNQQEASWAESVTPSVDSSVAEDKPAGGALFEPLNKRERQMLALLDQGLSNAEIAARCFIVEGTVKWNLHNLYGKLGVRSRTAALRAARAHGLLHS